jgi:hypothetical protein
MSDGDAFPLGRLEPTDWVHVERYPLTAAAVRAAPAEAERTLVMPRYRAVYDQGREGACVAFASSWMMSILNRRRYDPVWLWNRAKEVDEWPDTNPGDDKGTSVRAAMDVLRTNGCCRVYRGKTEPCDKAEGIVENRWATDVDGIRASIAGGTPVVLGVNWYVNFDKPVKKGTDWWIGEGELGVRRGGHAVCLYRVSDRRQAVGLVNSWGMRYPLVWLPYATVERLLRESGEATLVTDRP